MILPKVGGDKVVLVRADFNTGHILNNDGTLYEGGDTGFYEIYPNKAAANKAAAELILQNKNLEIILYDGVGVALDVISPPH